MIYTYPVDHPSKLPTGICVDSGQSFGLSEAKHILDVSRSGDLVLTYTGDGGWWNLPEIGRLFDFLGYRGAELIHNTGPHSTNHTAYLSARLEKLYTEDILDEWAKA